MNKTAPESHTLTHIHICLLKYSKYQFYTLIRRLKLCKFISVVEWKSHRNDNLKLKFSGKLCALSCDAFVSPLIQLGICIKAHLISVTNESENQWPTTLACTNNNIRQAVTKHHFLAFIKNIYIYGVHIWAKHYIICFSSGTTNEYFKRWLCSSHCGINGDKPFFFIWMMRASARPVHTHTHAHIHPFDINLSLP